MSVQSASYQLDVSCTAVPDKDVVVSAIPSVGAALTNQTDQSLNTHQQVGCPAVLESAHTTLEMVSDPKLSGSKSCTDTQLTPTIYDIEMDKLEQNNGGTSPSTN
jgi:hypothetical protein